MRNCIDNLSLPSLALCPLMAAFEKVLCTIPYLYMQCADERLLLAVGICVIEASRCDCAYWVLPLIADRSLCMYDNVVSEITPALFTCMVVIVLGHLHLSCKCYPTFCRQTGCSAVTGMQICCHGNQHDMHTIPDCSPPSPLPHGSRRLQYNRGIV